MLGLLAEVAPRCAAGSGAVLLLIIVSRYLYISMYLCNSMSLYLLATISLFLFLYISVSLYFYIGAYLQ